MIAIGDVVNYITVLAQVIPINVIPIHSNKASIFVGDRAFSIFIGQEEVN